MQVISGDVQISGTVIEPFSLVLTASRPLGVAPLVTIVAMDGRSLTGWVVGRDDAQNLALIRIVDGSLPGIKLGDSSKLGPGDTVLALGYRVSRPGQLGALEARIENDRSDPSVGMRFLELNILLQAGTIGGPLVNREAELVGMAVEAAFVQTLGFIVTQEKFALASESIESLLQTLRDGFIRLEPRPTALPDPGSPPPVPALYSGSITFKGAPPQEGTRLYARVFQEEIGDLWIPTEVGSGGTYTLVLGPVNPRYINEVVEFYMEGVKAQIEGLTILEQGVLHYEPGNYKQESNNRKLNLVFP